MYALVSGDLFPAEALFAAISAGTGRVGVVHLAVISDDVLFTSQQIDSRVDVTEKIR